MKLLSRLLAWPLASSRVRRRLRFELKQCYPNEEEISIPLGYGCRAPILSPDYLYSLAEVFFMEEYAMLGERLPLPRRWLDLGCHAGMFSLYVAWQHRRRQNLDRLEALLVDGDFRVSTQVEKLIEQNHLKDGFKFAHGAIAESLGSVRFSERNCMSSGTVETPAAGEPGLIREVPVLTASRLMQLLPPPYDLIKVDIEGGEYDFLKSYQEVLKHTNVLLLEWHGWHPGGGGVLQIKNMALELGFVEQIEIERAQKPAPVGNPGGECGVLALQRR